MDNRKATLDEIKGFYKFRPSLDIWFSDSGGKSYIHKLPDETWYGGPWFNTGYFIYINFIFFTTHIMIKWWRISFLK